MLVQLLTLEAFDVVLDRSGLVVIVDKSTGIRLHALPCSWVTRDFFKVKVVDNHGKNGSYFGVESRADAGGRFGDAVKDCTRCGSRIDSARVPAGRRSSTDGPESTTLVLDGDEGIGTGAGIRGPVRFGSSSALPFEPRGEMHDLRTRIRRGVAPLAAGAGEVLWGTIHAEQSALPAGADVENILFYNVGPGSFAKVSHAGLAWESAPAFIATAGEATWPVVVEYAVHPDSREFAHWSVGDVAVAFEDVALPRLATGTKPGAVWRAVHDAQCVERRIGNELHGDFALDLELRVPAAWGPAVISIVKPLVDGLISALHTHDGSDEALVVERLAGQLEERGAVVRARLADRGRAVLGVRRLLWPWRDGVQWNPADDRCRAARIRVARGTGDGFRLSGALVVIAPRGTVPAR